MYTGSYDPRLVVVSLLVATLASYTALDMSSRVSTSKGRTARIWLCVGAIAMGVGVWTMHFIGMLAFRLPIPLGYDPSITMASLAAAIVSSLFALWLVSRPTLPLVRLAGGALMLGGGVATMHYIGMEALRMEPGIHYTGRWFVLSIVIAIVTSAIALWTAFRLRGNAPGARPMRAAAAVLMGLAIVGTHYSGMAGANFKLGTICAAARNGADHAWLAIPLALGTTAIMLVTLLFSVLDRRQQARTSALASSLEQARELAYYATHDNLTKLPNRVFLERAITDAMRVATGERPFALMFMDLDGFKAVNDALGHHVGDSLLVEVAARVRATISEGDVLARVGGDEFVMLLHLERSTDAANVAKRVLAAFDTPFALASCDLRVTASIGIAVFPRGGADEHELLVHADAAMYQAKARGRNGFCFHDASMTADARARLQLMQDLRAAHARGEWVLHYQPKFDASSLRMVGVEALLRWNHPTRGLVAAGEFIQLAEQAGLISAIGEWVLEEACRQLAQWQAAGVPVATTAINLSAVQLHDVKLVERIGGALTRHALPPASLIVEITESTVMSDVETSMKVLQSLHEMGVQIAIDDFGTGYSSLLYLKRLPATELKIDRGFVRDLAHDTEDAAIVAAIVALGETLNLRIVAEGVETTAQQAALTQQGCDVLQGYLFGRPVAADALYELATA
jgi:diguanylate cyclase (GGDEF)-like protein